MKQLLLFLFLLSLFACGKVFKSHIKGLVVDATTNEGIAGVTVQLYGKKKDFLGSNSNVFVGIAISNAKGEFLFNFNAKNNLSYYVSAVPSHQYIDDGSSETKADSKLFKKIDAIIKLKPWGYIKLHLVKTSTQYLFIIAPGYSGGRIGTLDTLITIRDYGYIYGNQINQIGYQIRDLNGNITNYEDAIYCPAFDTTIYKINY